VQRLLTQRSLLVATLVVVTLLVATGLQSLAQTACPGLAVCFTSVDNTTRVTIEVSPGVHFTAKRLSNPERIFFDIEGANLDTGKSQTIPVADGLVKQIRTAERPPSVTRVVFDLEKPADFTTSEFHDPDRLVIELRPIGTQPSEPASKPSRPASKPPYEPEQAVARLGAKPEPNVPQEDQVSPVPTPTRLTGTKTGEGDVRFWSQPDMTRVSVEIPPGSQFTSKRLSEPERIFFDIEAPGIQMKKQRIIPVDDHQVKQIRVASTRPGVTRVVLDLEQYAEFTCSRASNPERLIIELRPKNHPLPPFPSTTQTTAPTITKTTTRSAAPSPEPIPPPQVPADAPAASITKVVPPASNAFQSEPPAQLEPRAEPAPSVEPKLEPLVAKTEANPIAQPAPPTPPQPTLVPAPALPPVPSPAPAPAPPLDKKLRLSSGGRNLKIVALQGEGAVNNIKTGTSIDPVVEVRDDKDMPLPGAEVTFQFPIGGAGGFFPGRSLTLTTRTNEQGQAQAAGAIPNDIAGRFNIKVAANTEDRTGSLVISQINVSDMADAARIRKRRSKKWVIVSVVAGAAVTAGIIVATHHGGSSSPASAPGTITVTPGPITIGTPQ